MSDFEYRINMPPGLDRAAEAREARPSIGGLGGAEKTGEGSFGKQLGQAIGALDQLQTDADGQAEAIANGGGNLHEVALAFEKADVAMRLATKVRNKVVDLYNEVMRMSV
jgi:flagellar hook-basal body complex protein FliE